MSYSSVTSASAAASLTGSSTPRDAMMALAGTPTDIVNGVAMTRAGQSPDSAPVVVMVHGMAAARTAFADVLPGLVDRFHVVVVDLPGHGDSDAIEGETDQRKLADQLMAALAELGITNPWWVGNSLGAWIGWHLAADGRIAGLLSLGSGGMWTPPWRVDPWLPFGRFWTKVGGPLTRPLMHFPPLRWISFRLLSHRPTKMTQLNGWEAARALQRNRSYWPIHRAVQTNSFERGAEVSADIPVHAVFGDNDPYMRPTDESLSHMPEHVKVTVWGECGHVQMWDQPAKVVAAVHELVDSKPAIPKAPAKKATAEKAPAKKTAKKTAAKKAPAKKAAAKKAPAKPA